MDEFSSIGSSNAMQREESGTIGGRRRRLDTCVEVPRETDLIPGPDTVRVVSGIRGVGQHLSLEKSLDAPWF
jgi:hypothetical protein